MSNFDTLPPEVTRTSARDVASVLREIADDLEELADMDSPLGDADEQGWGLRAADLGLSAMAAGEVMADSGMAVAALEGESLRRIGQALQFSFSAIPRRLAGTPELSQYAEVGSGNALRVRQGGVERARYDLRNGQYGPEGEVHRVQRRRRG